MCPGWVGGGVLTYNELLQVHLSPLFRLCMQHQEP